MRHIIAAALSLACVPAIAQDCLTYEAVAEGIQNNGGKIVGAASYDGAVTSEMLIVQTKDLILMLGFDANRCYAGQIAVEVVKKPDAGA